MPRQPTQPPVLDEEEDGARADVSGEIRLSATLEGAGSLFAQAEVVIVGGGVVGLAIAYNLARRGLGDVVVIERGYLAEGASGRNGGGVRQQWSTELNIRLMQESVDLCWWFAVDFGVNVWFRQGGYLFLACIVQEVAWLEKNIAIQNRCGVPTWMFEPDKASQIVSELDLIGIIGAAYNSTDGILFLWLFLWGYVRQVVVYGVRIFIQIFVIGFESQKGGGYLVHTLRGVVWARRLVNAIGVWSPRLVRMIGVQVLTYSIRHEICSSESLKPFLRPMVSELTSGLYCSQSMRGEIVGGVTISGHDSTYGMGSTLEFFATYARWLVWLMPILGEIKVLCQWVGSYDQSSDGNPILGVAFGHLDFFLACGFVGHGFMMVPIVGKLYGEWLTGGELHEIFARYILG